MITKAPTRVSAFFVKRSILSMVIATSFGCIQQVNAAQLWQENFDAPELNSKGAINSTIDMSGVTKWSIDVSSATLTANSDWFKVSNGQMEARDVDGEAIWLSEVIGTQGKTNLSISMALSENGTMEATDYIDVYYALDNGAFVHLDNWQELGDGQHTVVDDFTQVAINQAIADANQVQLKVVMKNNAGSEYLRLDEVTVTADDGTDVGEPTDPTPPNTGIISGACFNCPDLDRIATNENFVDGDYYQAAITAINNQQDSATIKQAIHDAISLGQRQLSYSEVWTALTVTDEDPNNTDNVILLYKGTSISKMSNGSGAQSSDPDNWNREHVWAKSHGFPSSSAYAYTDIHHLRPADISINSSRGNLDFDLSDAPLAEAPSNRVDSDSFEPRDVVKGDVARMVFYMDTRYDGSDAATPDLQVIDQLTNTGESKLGKLCTLLEWHQADPVDTFEQHRNNMAYELQGNRNPFVDHPEWAEKLYQAQCDGSTNPTPTPDPDPQPSPNAANLIISEYVEGSSYNKALEIFNPTANSVNLTGYQIKLYGNGSVEPTTTFALSGELASQDVVVLGSTQIADSSPLKPYIDVFTSAINFNGDDTVLLTFGENVIDSLGTIGVRENWGKDVTLVRNPDVLEGDTDATDAFDASVQWQRNAKDTFTSLGWHHITQPGTEPSLEIGVCGDAATLISTIQGDNDASLLTGQKQVIQAQVSLVANNLNGFFAQQTTNQSDNDESSSEGLFVYLGADVTMPEVGHIVRALGDVKEHYNRTQLSASQWLDCGESTQTLTAKTINLPIAQFSDWESVEGMLVSFPQTLSVVDNYNLGKYGQVILANGRLIKPTNIYPAGSSQSQALAERNALNKIMLDDMDNAKNPEIIRYPAPGLSAANTLRLGDQVQQLTGIVDFSYGDYRILPTEQVNIVATNLRQTEPQIAVSSLKVASFNVLNYFNGEGNGQGFPRTGYVRGANTLDEFERQSAKIVAAIGQINADILGLIEVENDGFSATSAIAELVTRINQQLGANTYQYVQVDQDHIGTDQITSGIIYKPSKVTPKGNAAINEAVPFDWGNRPPLVQSFTENATGEVFTLAVAHLKAKGSCSSATGGNQQGEQGCWNELRVQSANALTNWLATDPTQSDDPDVLIIGDLNSYGMEDPVLAIEQSGYNNMVAKFNGQAGYSYTYGGEIGYLDHALSSTSLTTQVVDTKHWHINADEPPVLDYNMEYKSAQKLVDLYAPDAYRASDHDPVVVALSLTSNVNTPVYGDFDGDNDVDMLDVKSFISQLRANQLLDLTYDFNHDGLLNMSDVRAMMQLCTRARCAVE